MSCALFHVIERPIHTAGLKTPGAAAILPEREQEQYSLAMYTESEEAEELPCSRSKGSDSM